MTPQTIEVINNHQEIDMSIGAFTIMTITGSLVVLKLAVMAAGIVLLARAMRYASHPGSMDPEAAEMVLLRQSKARCSSDR